MDNENKMTCIGTRDYMSPELLNGKRYDLKTDVWSAGCVLFELICLEKLKEFLSKQTIEQLHILACRIPEQLVILLRM